MNEDRSLKILRNIMALLAGGAALLMLFFFGVIRFIPEPSWHGLYPGMEMKAIPKNWKEPRNASKKGRWADKASEMGIYATEISLKETGDVVYNLNVVNGKISEIDFKCNRDIGMQMAEFAKKNYDFYSGGHSLMFTSRFPSMKHIFINKDIVQEGYRIEWSDSRLQQEFDKRFSKLTLETMFSNDGE